MLHKPTEIERLYIDFDCFFASVEQQLQPELRGQPVGVLPFMSDYSCVIAPSREAKRFGVKTGTRVKEALQLCPHIRFVPARHDVYVKLHHRIYEDIERCVHIDQACSIDEVVCSLLGQERKRPLEIARHVRSVLVESVGECVTCSLGFAPNQLLAKIASEVDKPEGLVIWHPDHYAEQLFKLELTDLPGIGNSMERRLHGAGIFSVEKLWHMSAETMRKVWGSIEGERFWYSLHGYAVEPIATSRCMYGHSRILSPESRAPYHARNCARLLTVKAARRLRRARRTAAAFSLGIRFQGQGKWVGEMRFARASDDHQFLTVLARLWHKAMQEWQQQNRHAPLIKQVAVTLYHLNDPPLPQGDLFDELLQENIEQQKWNTLAETMDNIVYRYGSKAVSLGVWEEPAGGYAGAKIAFGRIPSLADF
ncbi:MAG: type VI secretion protein ImpB [Gammaproteobacteria bacterium]